MLHRPANCKNRFFGGNTRTATEKRQTRPGREERLFPFLAKHGSGLWQRILEIRDSRHEYAHSGVSISDRFPSVSVAEGAIAKIWEAIRDIYTRAGKQIPAWVKSNAKRTASLSQRQKLVKRERGKYGLRNKVRSDCMHLCRRMETVPEDVIIWV